MEQDVKKYEKEVEFEEDVELHTLGIPKRVPEKPDGIIAETLVNKKIIPQAKYANYALIGASILFFAAALVFFALYVQTPPYEAPKPLNPTP